MYVHSAWDHGRRDASRGSSGVERGCGREPLRKSPRVTAHSYMAAEVVNEFFRGRVDPSLLTDYPQPFDVRQDVLEPGKSDTYIRQLRAALNTRNILKSLTERPATLAEIEANSPGADSTAIMAAY